MTINSKLLERIRENDISLNQVDLSSRSIDDNDIKILCEALNDNHHVISLDLSSNKIGSDGLIMLASNKLLISLDLTGNYISNKGLKAFLTNSSLVNLKIDNVFDFTSDWMYERIKRLQKVNRNRVFIRRNNFVMHWLKWRFCIADTQPDKAPFAILPLELKAHILSFLDFQTFLTLVSLYHFAHFGKTHEQAYECMLFILHNAIELAEQWLTKHSNVPLINEAKTKPNERLDYGKHFSFHKPSAVTVEPNKPSVELHPQFNLIMNRGNAF